MNYIAVFVGGGVGSICRYGIARWIGPMNLTFPYATLLANILSCILLGFFFVFFTKDETNEALKVLLLVGFCGGFSTFSTFTIETFRLVEAGNIPLGIANIFGNLLLCLIFLYLGSFLASKVL